MTPDRLDETPEENAEHGVLDDSGTLDTASISILGGHIAQVNVSLPSTVDDDRDDDVVEDELPVDDIVIPDAAPALPHGEDEAASAPVVEAHIDEVPTGDIILEPRTLDDGHDAAHHDGRDGEDEVVDAELVSEDHLDEGGDDASPTPDADAAAGEDPDPSASADAGQDDVVADADAALAAAEADAFTEAPDDADVVDSVDAYESVTGSGDDVAPADDIDGTPVGAPSAAPAQQDAQPVAAPEQHDDEPAEPLTRAPWVAPDEGGVTAAVADAPSDEAGESAPAPAAEPASEAAATEPASEAAAAAPASEPSAAAPASVPFAAAPAAEPAVAPAVESDASAAAPTAQPVAAATERAPQPEAQNAAAAASPPAPATRRAATGVIGTVPLTRREVHQADEAARVDRAHAMERVRTSAPEVTLSSKRLGELDDTRESPDLLTADRLLDPRQIARPEPEGLWQQLVYSLSRHRINLGDGRRARARKELDRRISSPLPGGARFVPVLSRKGGVGKTTVTALLGMALADARDDRIIAVDANPDRGTLADRVGRPNGRTVRDLVRARDEVTGYADVSSIVARDATRLDVLASDADPRVSEAFSDDDYRDVATVAAHYYSIVLTDTGTGIVHSVMGATLEQSDSLVIVAGLSVDEARLASETLTWLETNGYADRVRDAVVVLNNARPGTPLVRESELETHFRTRVRAVIRMPYDPLIATGSAISFRDLQPGTREAARELAAAVVEGLRSPAAAA
ncbi:MinD/ParA family protein [Microbacterium sp. HMH0099]|uniref:MinD/ParA family ATP-binding protein n=1 Tax=Microbacterium sp. HMH0099 TaxID=3414026 RepID=UPI003BF683B6